MLRSGTADFIAYGRLFIANPDLPERFGLDTALNPVTLTFPSLCGVLLLCATLKRWEFCGGFHAGGENRTT